MDQTDTTVMILAAGRGKRMRPLTDSCPKPLLRVGGKRLIEHHLQRLAQAGFKRVVINTAHLGHMIPEALGDGSRYGVDIHYSHESGEGLETAGGIINALPLLGEQPFIVINGDVWTDYPFEQLSLAKGQLAKLVLVENPEHNRAGDFALHGEQVRQDGNDSYTFSGIGIYHPALFAGYPVDFIPLREPLFKAIAQGKVGGEVYRGEWLDIGTPERLQALDQQLGSTAPGD